MDRSNSFIGASTSSAASGSEAKLEDFEAQQQWTQLDREKMDGVVVIVDPVLTDLLKLTNLLNVIPYMESSPLARISQLKYVASDSSAAEFSPSGTRLSERSS